MTSATVAVPLVRALPIVDDVSAGFWNAASRGELAIQRCEECRRFQHPPRAVCPECGSTRQVFEVVSGHALLFSWSMNRHSVLGGFDAVTPYLCVLVELIEQPGLILVSDYAGEEPDESTLYVGEPLGVTFVSTSDPAIMLPQFRPAESMGATA